MIQQASDGNAVTEDGIVIAVGMSVKGNGESFHDVFRHADEQIYAHKNELKAKLPSHKLR